MTARSIALTALALLALLASACGRSEERDVRAALEGLDDAIAKRDYQRLCDDVFSEKLIEEVERSVPCEIALKNSEIATIKQPKLEIKRIKIDGKSASADVRTSAQGQKPSDDTVKLVKEGGDWRILALAS